MYKRITTNIVEEHFDNIYERDVDVATTTDVQYGKNKLRGIFSTIPDENTVAGATLKQDFREYFTTYLMILRNYIVAKSYKIEDAELLKTSLLNHVPELNEVVRAWYLPEFRTRWVNSLTLLTKGFIDYVDEVSAGKQDAVTEPVIKKIEELAAILHSDVPNAWPEKNLVEIWTYFFREIEGQINARMRKDWAADQEALDRSFILLVQGEDTGLSSIADVMSRGIIKAQSWRWQS